MTESSLKDRLQRHLKFDLELVINENRSTMLSLLERREDHARLSIHKMFLEAPDDVISAVAHYVRGTRRHRAQNNLVLRAYIQKNLSRFDASKRLNAAKLVQEGRVYHLTPMYESINHHYFGGELDLKVTWFGAWGQKNRRRISLGLYHENLRLVKIHRMLDDPFFPEFFVSFIIYHEMLHAVVPGYVDASGRFCTHGREFKERERLFEHYMEAIEWEKQNKKHFFRG